MVTTLDLGRMTAESLKQGQSVSARVLQQRAEGVKDFVRSRSNIQSGIGAKLSGLEQVSAKRGLTTAEQAEYERLKAMDAQLTAQISEAREIRSFLTSSRNEAGVGPPTPPPKEAKAGYDPVAGTYRSGSTTYTGVQGITRDAQGNVKEVLLSRGGKQVTVRAKTGKVVEIIEPMEMSIDGGINQAFGKETKREAPLAVKQVGGFIGSTEYHYFSLDETSQGYVVTPLAGVNFSDEMKDYFATEFGKKGFVEKDGQYIFEMPVEENLPSFSIGREEKVEPFDFTKPFFKEGRDTSQDIIPEDVGFGDPLKKFSPYTSKDLIDAGATQYKDSKGNLRLGSPTRIVNTPNELYEEFLFFSDEASPIRKQYRTDYAQGAADYVKEQPWHKDFVIDTPLGKVGPGDFVGFTLTIPENYVKSIGAIGTVGRGVYEGMKQSAKGGELSYDYLIKAGDAYAAFPSFLELPQTAAITAMGRSPTPSGKDAVKTLSRFDGPQSKLLSSKLVGGEIMNSYAFRGGGGFDIIIQNPTRMQVANVLTTPLRNMAANVAESAPARIFMSAGKSATAFAGTQGIIETVPTAYSAYQSFNPNMLPSDFEYMAAKPGDLFDINVLRYERERLSYSLGKGFSKLSETGSQRNILIATGAGAFLGGIFQTGKELKPTFDAGVKGASDVTSKVVGSPGSLLRTGVAVAQDAYAGQKTLYFFAGSDRAAVSKIAQDNPVYPQAFMTSKGLNYYEMVKPKVKLERQPAPPQERLKTFNIRDVGLKPTKVVEGQSFRMAPLPKKSSRETVQDYGFSIFGSEARSDAKINEIRLEAINADIAREAGTTKGELVEAVKQGRGLRQSGLQGFGQSLGQRSSFRQKQSSFTFEIPRTGEFEFEFVRVPDRVRTAQRGRPPDEEIEVPSGGLVTVDFGFFDDGRKGKQKKKKGKQPKQIYAPSLVGVLTGKREKKVKKAYSGFEIRGVL